MTGIPDGIPVRHQLGAVLQLAGGVIGQTLAMEGMFAFFLESTFLGLLSVRREKARAARSTSWPRVALLLRLAGCRGYFIIATNAFMQHPVGYRVAPDGTLQLAELLGLPAQPLGAGGSTRTT